MNFISRKSPLRAFSWLLKAARGGNPAAFFKLSSMFMRPDSCPDLYPGFPSDIRVPGALLRRCKLFHSDYVRPCNKLLLDVVEDHGSFGALDDAKAILVDIANDADESTFDGQVDAKAAYLSLLFGQRALAAKFYARAFCQGEVHLGFGGTLVKLHSDMGEHAMSRLWLRACSKLRIVERSLESWPTLEKLLASAKTKLRDARDSCGGCGTDLQGDMRKYCGGCKAYCYCNGECQKKHWKRAKGGDREECLRMKEQRHMISTAIRDGRIKL